MTPGLGGPGAEQAGTSGRCLAADPPDPLRSCLEEMGDTQGQRASLALAPHAAPDGPTCHCSLSRDISIIVDADAPPTLMQQTRLPSPAEPIVFRLEPWLCIHTM